MAFGLGILNNVHILSKLVIALITVQKEKTDNRNYKLQTCRNESIFFLQVQWHGRHAQFPAAAAVQLLDLAKNLSHQEQEIPK